MISDGEEFQRPSTDSDPFQSSIHADIKQLTKPKLVVVGAGLKVVVALMSGARFVVLATAAALWSLGLSAEVPGAA